MSPVLDAVINKPVDSSYFLVNHNAHPKVRGEVQSATSEEVWKFSFDAPNEMVLDKINEKRWYE